MASGDLGERPSARCDPIEPPPAADLHRPGIAVVGERVEVPARRPAEHRDERRLGELGDLADGRDPPVAELVGGHRPDAPEPLDRERVEEGQLAVGRHHQQAVGLGHAARHLGEELRPGHADRDGQADPLADLAPQPHGDLGRRARDPPQPARRRGTPRRSTAPRPAASCLRTPRTPPCSPRSRPTCAARPRSPAGTGGGPALRPSPCGRRTPWPRSWPPARRPPPTITGRPAQARIVSLLDRRVERVEVGVQDRRLPLHEHMFPYCVEWIPRNGVQIGI